MENRFVLFEFPKFVVIRYDGHKTEVVGRDRFSCSVHNETQSITGEWMGWRAQVSAMTHTDCF